MFNNIRKKSFIILCVIMSTLMLLCSCSGSKNKGKEKDDTGAVEQGQIVDLKNFNGYTLKGNMFTNEMFADYDATVVYFWAPWSDASVYELKNIGTLAKRLPENVYLITVCLDSDEGKPKKILEDFDMSKIRTFVDGDADLKTACDSIVNIPCTVVVNGAGTVIGKPIVGVQEDFEKVYLKAINKALKDSGKDKITLLDLEEEEATTEAPAEEKTTAEKPETDETGDSGEEGSDEGSEEGSGEESGDSGEDSGEEYSEDSEDSEDSGDSDYSEDSESDLTDFD